MIFLGKSEHTIDEKLRLSIPARYRLAGVSAEEPAPPMTWVGIALEGGPLRLYREEDFAKLSERYQDQLLQSADVARAELDLYSSAEVLRMDAGGRVGLTRDMMETAGLGRAVVVAGAKSRLEVWDKARWEAEEGPRRGRVRELITRPELLGRG